jgi:hypothetical protein
MFSLVILAGVLVSPQAAPAAAGHRIRLIRATDRTPIAGAELYDIDGGDVAGRASLQRRMVEDPEFEFVKRAQRCVADGDGFVEAGPGRFHAFLARAPGWFQMCELFDFRDQRSVTLELFPDDPLTIELKDAHGAPLEGLVVELGNIEMCGSGPVSNSRWHAASDRQGHVLLPHYAWWVSGDAWSPGHYLTTQFPLEKAPFLKLGRIPYEAPYALPVLATTVTWELPPLAKLHVEFAGVDALPADRVLTFELLGPYGFFGFPDRWASDHGAPVEVPTGLGMPLRARFHWREVDPDRSFTGTRLAFGTAEPLEGRCALLRVPVASDPVELRVRPVHGDGSTFPDAVTAAEAVAAAVRRRTAYPPAFAAIVEWSDARGFRWRDATRFVAPDETGVLHFTWQRPRLEGDERVAALHVALVDAYQSCEFLDLKELAARDLAWPAGAELDVGTLVVSSR